MVADFSLYFKSKSNLGYRIENKGKERMVWVEYPLIDKEKTGARIKNLREKRGISISEVSTFLGLGSGQAVYKWQRGECLPSIDNLYALAKLFGTTMDDIIQGE